MAEPSAGLVEQMRALNQPLGAELEQYLQEVREANRRHAEVQQDLSIRVAVLSALERTGDLRQRYGRALEAILSFDTLGLEPRGGIFKLSAAGDVLELVVTRGDLDPEFLESERRVPVGSCLCGRVALSGELLVSADCSIDPRHERHPPGPAQHGHCIVPLRSGSKVLGVLFLYSVHDAVWPQERLDTLRQIGFAFGADLQREQAERQRLVQGMLVAVNHEINNPLQGILGVTDCMLRESTTSATQREQLEELKQAALRISELLGKSRILGGFEMTEYSSGIDMVDFSSPLSERSETAN